MRVNKDPSQLGEDLRRMVKLSEPELALLRAALTLRDRKGAYRDVYTADEREVLRNAKTLALRSGQRQLFMKLRVFRRYARRMWLPGPGCTHACPSCGKKHKVKLWRLTPVERAAELKALQSEVRKVRSRRKP